MEAYAGSQFVGIDLHRRRSVLVRMDQTGEVLETVRVGNSAENLSEVLTRAGECPEVVLEATYGVVLGRGRAGGGRGERAPGAPVGSQGL